MDETNGNAAKAVVRAVPGGSAAGYNPLGWMSSEFATNVHGCGAAKAALLLMLAGGADGVAGRRGINVLLAGGPDDVRRSLCSAAAELGPLGPNTPSKDAPPADGVVHMDRLRWMSASDQTAVCQLLDARGANVEALGMAHAGGPMLAVTAGRDGGWVEGLSLTENTAMPEDLLERFDMICVLDGGGWCSGPDSHHFLYWEMMAAQLRAARRQEPKMSKGAKSATATHYVEARRSDTMHVTPRYLDTVVRLAGAYAKMGLRDDIDEADVQRAIRAASVLAPVYTRGEPPRLAVGVTSGA